MKTPQRIKMCGNPRIFPDGNPARPSKDENPASIPTYVMPWSPPGITGAPRNNILTIRNPRLLLVQGGD